MSTKKTGVQGKNKFHFFKYFIFIVSMGFLLSSCHRLEVSKLNTREAHPGTPNDGQLKGDSEGTPTFKPVSESPAQNDPYQMYHWQLSNGLNVYFTQNKAQPNFYSEIVVRAGSANDPADATGLAHYLEHLMFKGTSVLGSLDYQKESKYQKQVEDLYAQRFSERDPKKRAQLQQEINKASVEAAKYVAISEFDSLYQALGANKLNAHTSTDETVYKVRFPKNRFQEWAEVESRRFQDPVFRLFQWELEVVYEEKNRTMDNPFRRLGEEFDKNIYAGHPYGDQTTIGTIEHLKNPPLHKVKKYFQTYYVPNNIAIAISGDLDPQEVIQTIEKNFGSWPAKALPASHLKKVPALKKNIVSNLQGPQQEETVIGFQGPAASDKETAKDRIFSKLLDVEVGEVASLGKVGEISAYVDESLYGGQIVFEATPNDQQPLSDVREQIFTLINQLKEGGFTKETFRGAQLKAKEEEVLKLETNEDRVANIRDTFIQRKAWSETSQLSKAIESVTYEDMLAFAKKYFSQPYVIVNFNRGDYQAPKVDKPEITPLTGSEFQKTEHSAFYKKIVQEAKDGGDLPYAPVNIQSRVKELEVSPGVQLFKTENPLNEIGDLNVEFRVSLLKNSKSCLWVSYIEKGSSNALTMAQLKKSLYSKGIDFSWSCSRDSVGLKISGEDSQLMNSLQDIIGWVRHIKKDTDLLASVKANVLYNRENELQDPNTVSKYLKQYVFLGKYSSNILRASRDSVQATQMEEWGQFVKDLESSPKVIEYVGRQSEASYQVALKNLFAAKTKANSEVEAPVNNSLSFEQTQNKVYTLDLPYMSQAHLHVVRSLFSTPRETDPAYFKSSLYTFIMSGSMSAPVFKEIREKRALAYSTYFQMTPPQKEGDESIFYGFVGTQSDKMPEVFSVVRNLLDNYMPSEEEYELGKSSFKTTISLDAPTFRELPDRYVNMKRGGMSKDVYDKLYDYLDQSTYSDIQKFYEENIAQKPYVFTVLGNMNRVDTSMFPKDYEMVKLNMEDIAN